ncbi:MAG: glycosyltransferase [Planctomycetales bacterium]
MHPDVVVSFTEKSNILTLQAARGLKARIVIAERTDPRHHQIARGWAFLRQRLYPRADLAGRSDGGWARYCRERFGCPVEVIPNAAPAVAPDAPQPATGEKRLIAVGRLDRHKQFDTVIRIFSRLRLEFPEWRLQIVGTGPEEERLKDLIRELQLERGCHTDRLGG